MKKREAIFQLIILILVILVFSGCATKIQFNAQRAPNLDTTGIRRIAVRPFDAVGSGTYDAARYATSVVTSRFQELNDHFTLVNFQTINDAGRRGESAETYVDATFTGQISRVAVNDRSENNTRRVNKGTRDNPNWVDERYTIFFRTVEVEFNYSFTRVRDGSLIGPINKRGSESSSSEDRARLPSGESMVRSIIDGQLRGFSRDVAPHVVSISRTLESDSNMDIKPQMDAALAQVRGSNYLQARDSYLAIWRSHNSVAAAINVSILYEVLGDTGAALRFMNDVFAATGSPKANTVIERLRNELGHQASVQQHAEEQQQRPGERAANHAVNEITKSLPREPRLWIYNTATSNQDLVNNVIDNMTSTFLNNGVTVVERQRINIIFSEQNFQYSGMVNDNDLVSIGRLAGVNTIVLIDIVGRGYERRLQVRVLDVTTGNVRMQSSASNEWQL